MWRRFQPNPCGKSVGDCAVRAICAALSLNWYEAYSLLCEEGARVCNMPSADSVWGDVLLNHGFVRYAIRDTCPNCYTVRDFVHDHPKGVYVLAIGGHVLTTINGSYLDSWDSGSEVVIFYYKRKED